MPIAMVLRSVPLVAMAPLLILVFGQGLASVIVIAGIISFFPTLVNVVYGLRSAPASAVDVAVAYGASSLMVLRKSACPAPCLPSSPRRA